jgi:hypothetical protein
MIIQDSRSRIRTLISQFEAEVGNSAAMGETDINLAAEMVVQPLLNEVFGWNLINLNSSEKINYPGIDLGDKNAGIAVQVTATSTLPKIHETLQKFVTYRQYEIYPKLIIFILGKRQKIYGPKGIQKIIQDKFSFDAESNIWDFKTILREIIGFEVARTLRVQKILEANLSEGKPLSAIPLAKSNPSSQFDWRLICLDMLAVQKQQNLTTHIFGAGSKKVPDVHVRLGLRERKDIPRVELGVGPKNWPPPEGQLVPISHDDFFDGVLKEKIHPKRIVVIGEPGAGKTTLLQTIAAQVEGFPIWVELSAIKKEQTLAQYLEDEWLKQVLPTIREHCPEVVPSLRNASKELRESFAELFGSGLVWLLLNGADEMATNFGQPLAWVSQQLQSSWVSQAKVVMTCRLNLWNSTGERLSEFDTYKMLDFQDGEIQEFITKWFANPAEQLSGQMLWDKLKQSTEQIRQLVRNPLRLALLCLTWKKNGERLPVHRVGLYQRFVDAYYQWKMENPAFQLSRLEQEQLNEALGKLAKVALENEGVGFRLRRGFILQHLNVKLFEKAEKLGWLVLVGLPSLMEKNNLDEDVFTFWHPTFQEYFAALDIVRTDINLLFEPDYIFNNKWKEVIILSTGLINDAYSFLHKIKYIVDASVNEIEEWQEFLWWVALKTIRMINVNTEITYLSVAIRAFYLGFMSPRYMKLFLDMDLIGKIDHQFFADLSAKDLGSGVDPCQEFTIDYDLMLALDYAGQRADEIDRNFEYAHLGIYPDQYISPVIKRTKDEGLKSELQKIIPVLQSRKSQKSSLEFNKWWQKNNSAWIRNYCQIISEYRDIGWKWNFTPNDVKAIGNYRSAHHLLLDCIEENEISIDQKLLLKRTMFLPFFVLNSKLEKLQRITSQASESSFKRQLDRLLALEEKGEVTPVQSRLLTSLRKQVEDSELLNLRAQLVLSGVIWQ